MVSRVPFLIAAAALLIGCAAPRTSSDVLTTYTLGDSTQQLGRRDALRTIARNIESDSVAKALGLEAPIRVIRSEVPELPEQFDGSFTGGDVVVQFSIAPSGDVVGVRIAFSSHPALSEVVSRTMAKWVFMPLSMKGAPRIVTLELPLRFTLEKEPD